MVSKQLQLFQGLLTSFSYSFKFQYRSVAAMSDYITCHIDSLGVTPCSHVLRDLDAHAPVHTNTWSTESDCMLTVDVF